MSKHHPPSNNTVPLLARALHRIRSTPPRIIASPATQPRRAAVALIIRVQPAPNAPLPPSNAPPPTLSDFFNLDWVNHPNASPELLFLHREDSTSTPTPVADATLWQAKLRHNTNEAHVAFPGGRTEPDDEGGLYTAMRQTWEEIGIDLAEPCYSYIGQLDDREITTSLGKRLLMILSPFVFLQLTPDAPPPDPVPSTSLHWTTLSSLVSQNAPVKWSTVTVDAASRLAPKHSAILRFLVRLLIGSMQFPAIILQSSRPSSPSEKSEKGKDREKHPSPSFPSDKQLKLWGLSLGMTLDLMSYMILPLPIQRDNNAANMNGTSSSSRTHTKTNGSQHTSGSTTTASSKPMTGTTARTTPSPASPLSPVMQLPYQPVADDFRMEYIAPSLASVFPRFSYPDVNFWIWVFGKRYREVVRGWEASVRDGGTNDRRVNWSGSALNTFYAAIRKALVVVIVARALGVVFGVSFALWWIFS